MFERDRDYIMLRFTLSECGRALEALTNVDASSVPKANPRHSGGQIFEIVPVFDSIRLALQLSANVSRMLWPPRNAERGEHLRTLAGIPNDHPLRDRKLRNHVEHIDERLDVWTTTSPRPFIGVEMIKAPGHPSGPPGTNIEDMAAVVYDQDTRTVHLFGDSFSMTNLRANLIDVGNLLRAVVGQMDAEYWQTSQAAG